MVLDRNVAIITGGTAGIGRGMARVFARERAGAVALCSLDAAQAETIAGLSIFLLSPSVQRQME